MLKNFDNLPFYIIADTDKVLCDGESMTGLGGRVSGADTAILDKWKEMTEEEAIALCPTDSDEEATVEDYENALAELGVELS